MWSIKQIQFFLINLTFIFIGLLMGCSKSPTNQGVNPTAYVNFQLNLSEPQYNKLLYPNNYVYVEGQGNKGVIVTNYNSQYYAIERQCPYQPSNTCSKVEVQPGSFNIRCGQTSTSGVFTKCCDSKYFLDGSLLKGPSVYSLTKYNITFTNNTIYVSN